eukprot:3675129-Pleurochrysis_carterae.AAC.1
MQLTRLLLGFLSFTHFAAKAVHGNSDDLAHSSLVHDSQRAVDESVRQIHLLSDEGINVNMGSGNSEDAYFCGRVSEKDGGLTRLDCPEGAYISNVEFHGGLSHSTSEGRCLSHASREAALELCAAQAARSDWQTAVHGRMEGESSSCELRAGLRALPEACQGSSAARIGSVECSRISEGADSFRDRAGESEARRTPPRPAGLLHGAALAGESTAGRQEGRSDTIAGATRSTAVGELDSVPPPTDAPVIRGQGLHTGSVQVGGAGGD